MSTTWLSKILLETLRWVRVELKSCDQDYHKNKTSAWLSS